MCLRSLDRREALMGVYNEIVPTVLATTTTSEWHHVLLRLA